MEKVYRVEAKGDKIDAQDLFVVNQIEKGQLSPILLQEVKNVEVDGWHQLRSVQQNVAGKRDP